MLNALDLQRRIVREVMRPRQEIAALDTEASIAECLDVAEKTRYSRFPLCEGGNLGATQRGRIEAASRGDRRSHDGLDLVPVLAGHFQEHAVEGAEVPLPVQVEDGVVDRFEEFLVTLLGPGDVVEEVLVLGDLPGHQFVAGQQRIVWPPAAALALGAASLKCSRRKARDRSVISSKLTAPL